MTTLDVDQAIARSRRRHRSDVLLTIVLPLLAGILLIGAIMAFVVLLPRAVQVSLVADFTLLLFVLCPMALCTLPFSIGLVVLAFLSGRLHGMAGKPLRRAEALSVTASQKVVAYSDRIARASIALNARLAPVINRLDAVFEPQRPAEQTIDDKEKS